MIRFGILSRLRLLFLTYRAVSRRALGGADSRVVARRGGGARAGTSGDDGVARVSVYLRVGARRLVRALSRARARTCSVSQSGALARAVQGA